MVCECRSAGLITHPYPSTELWYISCCLQLELIAQAVSRMLGQVVVHTVTYKEWHAFALLASALGNDMVAVQA